MLAAHGESQRGLLSNGRASLRDAVRAGFFDPCEPPMAVAPSIFHAKQKRPRERPAQAPVRTTSRTPWRHCTPMVQHCTGNYHGSVAVRPASQAMVI